MLTDFGRYKFNNYNRKKKYINLHTKSILFCLYFLAVFPVFQKFPKNMPTWKLYRFYVSAANRLKFSGKVQEGLLLTPEDALHPWNNISAWTIGIC